MALAVKWMGRNEPFNFAFRVWQVVSWLFMIVGDGLPVIAVNFRTYALNQMLAALKKLDVLKYKLYRKLANKAVVGGGWEF